MGSKSLTPKESLFLSNLTMMLVRNHGHNLDLLVGVRTFENIHDFLHKKAVGGDGCCKPLFIVMESDSTKDELMKVNRIIEYA